MEPPALDPRAPNSLAYLEERVLGVDPFTASVLTLLTEVELILAPLVTSRPSRLTKLPSLL